MSHRTWVARLAAVAMLASLSSVTLSVTPAEAQFGKRLKERLKRNAEDKAIDKAVEKENEAIDAATSGKADEDTARVTAEPTEPGSAAAANASAPAGSAPGASAGAASPTDKKVWANYDFVPGQRTLFYSDFTEDQVGNFPQRLEFKSGQMEIVEFEGGQRALKASNTSELRIPLPEALPEKFTIELDVINRNSRGSGSAAIEVAGGADGLSSASKGLQVKWGFWGLETSGGGIENQKEYGVGEGQLTAKGYGDTKPSADNKSPEGRANNRRVELVKS